MKRTWYKRINVCVASSLILSMLGSCSTSETPESTNDSGSTTQSDSDGADVMTITYWDAFCDGMLPESYTESLIEGNFPVDISVNRTNNDNMMQVSALLTEEKLPDVFWINEPSAYINSLELTRTIPREMLEEYAPSFLEIYDTYPTIYTSVQDMDNPDEFFALNGATDQSAAIAGSLYADFYRYDWIQALDIDLGVEVTQISDNFYVASNGLTLDKFEEVMHGFTYGDPDGNGIDDTKGASFEGMTRFDLLYSGFGMIAGISEENGAAERHYTTSSYKDFSFWFSDMFSKGYFDEDFFYQNRTDRWEKVNNEEYGYFLESSIAINSWASDRPPLSLLETNPEATFLITPGLSDNEGQGTIIKNAMPTYGRLCYINKDVDDEKLAMILQVLEYINFGEDKISMWFGEEGVDWKYDDTGRVEVLNQLATAENGARVFVQNVQTDELFKAVSVEPVFEAGSEFWLYDCIWRENDREQYQYKLDLYGETNYGEMFALYNGACAEVSQQYFEDWIYNGLDIDASWDDMLEELDEAGYNIMMDELDAVIPLEEMILTFVD
ncbi:MAG: hypothetical protein R3Y63_10915 [Eubacteriales bacterium]